MNLSTEGIVLRVQTIGESDRLCTLLTARYGVIRAFSKGAKNIKNKNFTATSQFAYGRYELYFSRDRYVIDESHAEQLFVPLRDDIEKLALGQYLCELAGELAPREGDGSCYMRLMLMALHHLAKGSRPAGVIKAASELRMLAMAGYMPDLVMCADCGAYEADVMHFLPLSGRIRCSQCGSGGEVSVELSRGALSAMRHSMYVDLDKTFSFALAEPSLTQLTAAAERYLYTKIERDFTTLDFYKGLTALS